MLRRSLEGGRISEHRETCRTAGFIGAGKRRWVEIGADQSLGRARLLDLGNQRVLAACDFCRDGRNEPARRSSFAGCCLDRGERAYALCGRYLLALVGADALEHIHGYASLDTFINRSSRFPASPESTDF